MIPKFRIKNYEFRIDLSIAVAECEDEICLRVAGFHAYFNGMLSALCVVDEVGSNGVVPAVGHVGVNGFHLFAVNIDVSGAVLVAVLRLEYHF